MGPRGEAAADALCRRWGREPSRPARPVEHRAEVVDVTDDADARDRAAAHMAAARAALRNRRTA